MNNSTNTGQLFQLIICQGHDYSDLESVSLLLYLSIFRGFTLILDSWDVSPPQMESTCGSPEHSDSFFFVCVCESSCLPVWTENLAVWIDVPDKQACYYQRFQGRTAEQNLQNDGDCLRKVIDATQTGAQPSCWELLEVCEGLWCITCVLVCCSAPAEGRTIRLWSAWCGPPGIFLGVWGSMLFLLQLLVSLSASLCTYWLDFGLFKASLWINTTQTINGASLTLAALFLPLPLPLRVVCVCLLASGSRSLEKFLRSWTIPAEGCVISQTVTQI